LLITLDVKEIMEFVEIICGDHGAIPIRGTNGSAGYDFIYNLDKDIVIKAGSQELINLGVKISLPENSVMMLETRSSFAVKGVIVIGGVIDSDYRGEIKVNLLNTSKEDFVITKGMKITQGVILNYNKVVFKETTKFTTNTERGEGGFGSTDKELHKPVHLSYILLKTRIDSFKNWPTNGKPTPIDLAEAGFFYTGESDKTKCFHCDIGLDDWESDDVPWEQHAINSDRCRYLNISKGKDYIKNIILNLKK